MLLSKLQALNLRSGQTVHYVWGNTVSRLYVNTSRLVGKRSCLQDSLLHSNMLHYRSWTLTSRVKNRLLQEPSWSTLRSDVHYIEMFASGLGGAIGGRYFTKFAQAERYRQELLAGLYPAELGELASRHLMCDELDELMGVCDRGLGFYEERTEYEYNESDEYFQSVAAQANA